MRFPSAWPRLFRHAQHDLPIVDLAYSKDKLMLAVITKCSLTIYCDKPRAIVSNCCRSTVSLQEYGENISVHWKPDNSAIAVLVGGAYVFVYQGLKPPKNDLSVYERVLLFEYPRETPYINGAGEGWGIPACDLSHVNTIHIQSGVACLYARQEVLDIGTMQNTVQAVRWSGTMDVEGSFFLNEITLKNGNAIPEDVHVSHLDYSRQLNTHAAALSDGSAVVFAYQHGTNTLVWGNRIEACGITRVAFCSRYLLLAVGCSNGEVRVYRVDTKQLDLYLSHVCSLKKKNMPHGSVGGVSSLRWAPDGMTLAVGYTECGFSVWTVFGSLTFCSAADDYRLEGYTTPEPHSHSQWPGVHQLEWGRGSFQLSLATRSLTAQLIDAPFCHNAFAGCFGKDNQSCALLVDSERLMLYYEGYGQKTKSWLWSDVDRLCDVPWDIISIPQEFLIYNWPIKYAAIDKGVELIAIAGERGVAYFHVEKRKWTVAGSQVQEQELACRGGLVWWEGHLVVPCAMSYGTHELRMYANGLDQNHLAWSCSLDRACVSVNVCGVYLLVLTSDRILHIHTIYKTSASGLQVTKIRQVSLKDFIPLSVCACDVTFSDELQTLLLNVAGDLHLVPLPGGSLQYVHDDIVHPEMSPAVFQGAECIWTTTGHSSLPLELQNALFIGEKSGMMSLYLPGAEGRLISFGLSAYPLGVFVSDGIIFGLEADVMMGMRMNETPFEFMTCQHSTQIFIHHILKELLCYSLEKEAIALGEICQALPYFSHALELMIHSALESENAPVLEQAIQFVMKFPMYLEVIAHCARKTEVALWDTLFQRVGNPRSLFEICLQEQRLHTASSYLVILQNLEPPAMSRQLATRLLNVALDNDQWELAKELMRFLAAIADDSQFVDASDVDQESGTDSAAPKWPRKRSVGVQTDMLPNAEKFYVDLLLSRYARKLLTQNQIRALCLFAMNLSFPLKQWLMREKCRAARVDNYESAFRALHFQFSWTPPTGQAGVALTRANTINLVATAPSMHSFDDADWASISGRRDSHTPPNGTRKPDLLRSTSVNVATLQSVYAHRDCTNEVEYLLDLCLVSMCHDWAALLCTMLQKPRILQAVLVSAKHDKEYYGGAEHVMDKLRSLAYTDMGRPYKSFLESSLQVAL